MSERLISITLDAPACSAGDTITGTAHTAGLPPGSPAVVRLGWWADGLDDERPAGDLAQARFVTDASGETRFSLSIPEDAPPTMDGSLFSVRHAVELSAAGATSLLPVVVSPTRAPLDLVSASVAIAGPAPKLVRFLSKFAPKTKLG